MCNAVILVWGEPDYEPVKAKVAAGVSRLNIMHVQDVLHTLHVLLQHQDLIGISYIHAVAVGTHQHN